MRLHKKSLLLGTITFFVFVANAQKNVVSKKDLLSLSGKWEGKLVYLDYQTNEPYEMPANLEVKTNPETNYFYFIHSYPNEASANETDTIMLAANGKTLDNERVVSKKITAEGNLEIVTEIEGKDGNDNKDALMRHTWLIGSGKMIIKKEVQFNGTSVWVLRHTYSYNKVPVKVKMRN